MCRAPRWPPTRPPGPFTANSGSDEANAFVLPGGKVFVYSGILPITRNQHGLAAVLGHEIAHNLAQHHGERLSARIGSDILLYALIILTAPISGSILGTQVLGNWLLDTVFGRPMSRKMESEADYIGLMLMAEACYDPREAVTFWRRMERAHKAKGDAEIAEWLSTHPSVCSLVFDPFPFLPARANSELFLRRIKAESRTSPSGYQRL